MSWMDPGSRASQANTQGSRDAAVSTPKIVPENERRYRVWNVFTCVMCRKGTWTNRSGKNGPDKLTNVKV